jgi:hypothetical protein
MTRQMASETVVEYDFRCFCGTPIVTTEKTMTCTNCGRTFEIRRVGKRTHWRVNTAQSIGVQDVLELVGRPVVFITLLLLLLCWLYDLACV